MISAEKAAYYALVAHEWSLNNLQLQRFLWAANFLYFKKHNKRLIEKPFLAGPLGPYLAELQNARSIHNIFCCDLYRDNNETEFIREIAQKKLSYDELLGLSVGKRSVWEVVYDRNLAQDCLILDSAIEAQIARNLRKKEEMTKKTQVATPTLKVKLYNVIGDQVEKGIVYGLHRFQKYREEDVIPERDKEALVDEISEAVMRNLCEVIDFWEGISDEQ